MRVLACLALFALLIPAIPAQADLFEADGMIGISAREVGWVVRFPREWFTLLAEGDRPDGRAHYYLGRGQVLKYQHHCLASTTRSVPLTVVKRDALK